MNNNGAKSMSRGEILDLRARLEELEATLGAIRSGEVDALIVNGPNGDQVYSLKGAEQPYRAFIERMGEGAVTIDSQGTILYCNQRFADMLETPLQRVISTSFFDYLLKQERPVFAAILGANAPGAANFSLHSKNRKNLPVRIAMCVLEDVAEGTHCAVVTDLTEQQERKVLSESIEKLRTNQAELEKQYNEVQAIRAKLEDANAAKDEFLAALSHELRTPLTPVLLVANAIAVDPTLPPALLTDVETIRRNVELEARLIDDLLDLTRITRGKLKIIPQPTDIHETILRALDICEADTVAKPLKFTRKYNAKEFFVNADAVRLQQIFWNLLRNAVKFTPDGGTVVVTTKNRVPKSKRRPQARARKSSSPSAIPASASPKRTSAASSTPSNRAPAKSPAVSAASASVSPSPNASSNSTAAPSTSSPPASARAPPSPSSSPPSPPPPSPPPPPPPASPPLSIRFASCSSKTTKTPAAT